jgi:hypothetical protein
MLETPLKLRPLTCLMPGCDGRYAGNGLCQKHNKRLQRHGDPTVVRMVLHQGTPEERFRAKVDQDGPLPPYHPELGPCHVWTGARSTPAPYGVFWTGEQVVYAHQYAVQLDGRAIPEGMEPDHLCEVVWCVRPEHLEVVTRAENIRRQFERRRARKVVIPGP